MNIPYTEHLVYNVIPKRMLHYFNQSRVHPAALSALEHVTEHALHPESMCVFKYV